MKKTAVVFWVLIPILSIALLVLPKKQFSENENRYLAAFPVLSFADIENGRFTADLNTYLTDHFPGRDFFVGVKTQGDLLTGRKCINHVYVVNKDLFIEAYQSPSNTERIAGILSKFHDKVETEFPDIRLQLALVPTAVTIYEDMLPAYAPSSDQVDTISRLIEETGIAAVDVTDALSKHRDEEYLYYRTDHHWTTTGAYYAYEAYCEASDLTPVALDALDSRIVTEQFYGTLYSKVRNYGMKGDSITLYENPAARLTVNYIDTGIVTNTLYNPDYLDKKDKYSLFLDNLHSLIEITNENADTDRELVLVKDSYANSMVPFLVQNFRKIYVFDTRSYKKGVVPFLQEHDSVTDILLLYNMNTIDSDTGIYGIY